MVSHKKSATDVLYFRKPDESDSTAQGDEANEIVLKVSTIDPIIRDRNYKPVERNVG